MRRCIGHETKQRVGRMQNDSRHKSSGFDCTQKAAYHDGGGNWMRWWNPVSPTHDLAQCLEVSTCWMHGCLATSWHTGSKLIWIELFPELINKKEFAHLNGKSLREKPTAIGRMPPDFLFMARRGSPNKIGPPLKGSVLTRPDGQKPSKKWGNRGPIPGTSSSRVYAVGAENQGPQQSRLETWELPDGPLDSLTNKQLSCCGAGKLPAFPEAGGVFLSAWKEKHQKGQLGTLLLLLLFKMNMIVVALSY